MLARFHISMTEEAIGQHFDKGDLDIIIRANLEQDSLRNIFNPIVHFDDSRLEESQEYIVAQRRLAADHFLAGDRQEALRALGRLLHTRQDFYAHSNWAALWVERHGGLEATRPDDVEICADPAGEAGVMTGRASLFWYFACRLPLLGNWLERSVAPSDSHEVMNLDYPERGPLFAYALQAATNHTREELRLLLDSLAVRGGQQAHSDFLSGGD
jgi:hypothetical protein